MRISSLFCIISLIFIILFHAILLAIFDEINNHRVRAGQRGSLQICLPLTLLSFLHACPPKITEVLASIRKSVPHYAHPDVIRQLHQILV